jgi:hypothetical protein
MKGPGLNSPAFLFMTNIEPLYSVRFIHPDNALELMNLYQLAKVPLSGTDKDTPHYRMLWASGKFSKAHPEVSSTGAYKDLTGLLGR